MARSRNIKPSIMDNEDLADFDPLCRLLFVFLWMLADREGRLEDRPKRIAAKALPFDRSADVDKMLSDLAHAGFIHRYEVNGCKVIQIVSFLKHQTPHGTEKDSVLPDDSGLYTVHKRGKHGYATGESTKAAAPSTVIKQLDDSVLTVKEHPDSLIHRFTDSLIHPTDVGEVAQSAPPLTSPKATRGSRLPEDWFLPKAWGEWALAEFPSWTAEIVRTEAEKFRDHWLSESGAKARKVDWLATWRKWCRSDIAQRANAPPSAARETPYAAHMRQRVEQAAGSMAHIVAAKPSNAPAQRPKEPWEVAADEQRTIEADPARAIAIGMD